jgi:hypothetical protein
LDSNIAAQLDLKTELYFVNGSSEVWVVYPKTRKVLVHKADGKRQGRRGRRGVAFGFVAGLVSFSRRSV